MLRPVASLKSLATLDPKSRRHRVRQTVALIYCLQGAQQGLRGVHKFGDEVVLWVLGLWFFLGDLVLELLLIIEIRLNSSQQLLVLVLKIPIRPKYLISRIKRHL